MNQQMPDSPMDSVRLRDVTEADLPIFFEYQLDPEATQMADLPSEERDVYMADWTRILVDESNILKTILFNGQVAGNLVSWEESGERGVGYWLGKEYWGKGIATRALTAFLGQVKARPLYAHIAKHNIASLRVLEKCGFRKNAEQGEEFILILD